jgi:DNA polymerase III subunit epsilon
MGDRPDPGDAKALARAAWAAVDDLDLVELNEAFAASRSRCIRELELDPSRVNVRGGAIALGHPIGSSGCRVLVTLLHAMRARDETAWHGGPLHRRRAGHRHVRGALNATTKPKGPRREPPPGPPWDLPLGEAPLAFVDLEMTGLDAKKDRVVEVCIERVRGGVVEERLHTLVRPEGGEIGNVHVHGLGAEALERAPTFAEIAAAIEAILKEAVLIAHGASWDVAFLEAEMTRASRPSFAVPFYIDTLHLSRRTFALAKHSLDALSAHFGLDRSRAHRADADVIALRQIFDRCIGSLEPSTPRDVWQVRIAEGKAREQIISECQEAAASGRAVSVIYRPRAKAPQTLTMVIQTVLAAHDPPRVIGYLLPGRGRKELRADRILRIEPQAPSG